MESAWKDIIAIDCTFEFKTFNMTLNGKEEMWAFRQQLTLNGDNTRLDWGIFAGSYSIDSDGIVRTSTDMVAYKNDASTYELGRFFEIILWTASFNDEGLMSTVTIEQLWYDYEDGEFGRRRRMLSDLSTRTRTIKNALPTHLGSKETQNIMHPAALKLSAVAEPSRRRSLLTVANDAFNDYISGPTGWNTAMIYWMKGNEMWKTVVDENVHLLVPAFGIDCVGPNECWESRLLPCTRRWSSLMD